MRSLEILNETELLRALSGYKLEYLYNLLEMPETYEEADEEDIKIAFIEEYIESAELEGSVEKIAHDIDAIVEDIIAMLLI